LRFGQFTSRNNSRLADTSNLTEFVLHDSRPTLADEVHAVKLTPDAVATK
jgi:hypothetical protein